MYLHTDKKENQIFFIYKEIQSGAVAKSYMRKGFLKVPKCEIFDRSDFHDFYSIKPFWIGDFEAKI